MNLYSPVISGSLTVTGSTSFIGNVTMTGTVSATASNAELLSGTGSVGFTTTGSFTTMSGSVSSRVSQIETVYATTGSNSFRATQSITGSLTVTGQITAQTLNVQQVTSSIIYSSGSNVFGCDLNSRQTFTGSVLMTGSLIVNTTGPELQVNNNGVILGNLTTDRHGVTGSFYQTGSVSIFNSNVGIGTINPGYQLEIVNPSSDPSAGLFRCSNGVGVGIGRFYSSGLDSANTKITYSYLQTAIEACGPTSYCSRFEIFGACNGALTRGFMLNGIGVGCFLGAVCSPAIVGGTISGTTGTFSSILTNTRLGVGISADQNYASIFVGGDITSGANQYALILDPQLSGTNSYGLFANARIKASTAVTNTFGVYIPTAEKLSGASIANNYALYIANQTSGASVNYSIYSSGGLNYFGGNLSVGTTCAAFGRALTAASDIVAYFSSQESITMGISSGTGAQSWGIQVCDTGDGGSALHLNARGGNVGINIGAGNSASYPLHVNGTAYATGAAGALSDCRRKQCIQSLSKGLSEVMRLNPVEFEWKNQYINDCGMAGTQLGFIAQEVREVLPSSILVDSLNDNTLALKINEFIPILTKAIQEQQCTINLLKTCIGIS